MGGKTPEPEWMALFLSALRERPVIRAAARTAGVPLATAYSRRRTDEDFAREWNAALGKEASEDTGENTSENGTDALAGWGGARRIGSKRIARFLETLAETSNVSAAAKTAGIEVRTIYRLRRDDAGFAARWQAALAEGYDNLEMELLAHLRGGDGHEADAGRKGKFDTASALRSLAAHRESVAREKGRRTLADEVTTIASINAKIDALRARAKANERAIRSARRKKARDDEA
ncbi:hypothetical protein [Qipengyuania sp. MTN3-11]|uniref:hypothetical protein n=1 Tax=Qipengyuania sp. MTN3-11 TaxID=3056557 RepID=UPI0036F1D97C